LDLIMSTPFEECMKRKRRAQVGIDEVATPMYHRSGLEYLAQGTPCICRLNAFAERILKDATGANSVPFVNSTPATLRETISEMLSNDGALQVLGQVARVWIDEFYHPRELLKRYFEVYER
jgi:glycosyltransferase involved in cell wall biosynthesis